MLEESVPPIYTPDVGLGTITSGPLLGDVGSNGSALVDDSGTKSGLIVVGCGLAEVVFVASSSEGVASAAADLVVEVLGSGNNPVIGGTAPGGSKRKPTTGIPVS